MGRGLSKLQRTILVRALDNRKQEGRGPDKPGGADVYHAKVLADYFGWELPAWYYRRKKEEKWRSPASQKFSRADIGEKRYVAAQAAISRSLVRLQDRGLVVC